MKESIVERKYLILSTIIVVISCLYFYRLNYSPLWFDEAIEYFYSKVLIGKTVCNTDATNMYQRICSTYQPPLYNVLMHIWLLFFDSETGFRTAGVVTTIIGAVAIFKSLDNVCKDQLWIYTGTAFYLLTSGISYYALECAEYNLMICFEAWVLYSFIKVTNEFELKYLALFFVFSCLSVYSQYGAAFFVLGLYIMLVVIYKNNKVVFKKIFIFSLLTFFAAVIPLAVLFLLPQMKVQGSAKVSHIPTFIHSVMVDFLKGIYIIIRDIFGTGGVGTVGIAVVVSAIFVFAIVVAFCSKDKKLKYIFQSFLISYSIYYIAVSCSFYGYNGYSGTLGTNNIGGRYVLFFVPILVISMIWSVSDYTHDNHHYKKLIQSVFIFLFVFLCLVGIRRILINWEKSDMRGAVSAWYSNKCYENTTFVFKHNEPTFQYYIIHNDDYCRTYQENLIITEATTDDIIREGIDVFYVVCSEDEYSVDQMQVSGYNYRKIYADSTLLLKYERI